MNSFSINLNGVCCVMIWGIAGRMFLRYFSTKPKPKMKPIELSMPLEQTETIAKVIFNIVKEHGLLTVAETWERVKVCERSWIGRIDRQKPHENSVEMYEGEAEAQVDMQSCRATQAISVHKLVHKIKQHLAGKTSESFFTISTQAALTITELIKIHDILPV
ncbi:hypothetical protein Pint_07309 [Pistacia integerrima]|uniref:Uncharacterized protein n=1 Tax=Pistacia integerrima TaxID=434235 RepID=A0ACC0XYL5_9ROSI|nr:hypothetical protein Pint_07309 [Pistacia integerrima]